MKTQSMLLLAAAFLCAATPSFVKAEDAKKSSLNTADEKFVKTAAQSGMAEVKIAELGVQKAQRAEVKELAQMMVKDHTEVNTQLKGLAKTKGVELSAVVDADAVDTFKGLEKQSGADFDKEFLATLEKHHKETIAAYEDAEKESKDNDLTLWVTKTLPSLRGHLDKVKSLEGK